MTSAIEDRWQCGKLGDLLPLKYGKGLPEKSRDSSGQVPVFGSSGQVGRHSHPLTNGPTLIVGRKGTVGAVHLSLEPCWPIDTVYFAEAAEGQNLKYYKYLLDSLNLARLDRSTAVPGLSRDDYNAVEVAIAPPREQERIVAEIERQFSRLDEAVANLKRYKAAVLDAAVKGRIGAKSAASGDELPADWGWSSIGQPATVGTGATPARSNEAFYRGGTIPWITSSAVNEPFVDAAEQFVTDEALRQTNLTLYPRGTLLVAMYGEGKTRGKCSELRIAATTNQALAALQVDPTVRPWLKMFLEHNYDYTRRIASGGVQPNLNLGLIRSIKLPVPPAAQQHRIVAEVDRRLSLLAETERQVERDLHRAGVTRASLLSKVLGVAR